MRGSWAAVVIVALAGLHCSRLDAPSRAICTSDAECASSSPCDIASCHAGACVAVPRARGTLVPGSEPGNCRHAICDGEGGVIAEEDRTDLPPPRDPCTRPACVDGDATYLRRDGEACPNRGMCLTTGGCVLASSLALRDSRSCFVADDGAVMCWGATGGGFPDRDPSATSSVTKVAHIPPLRSLSLGPRQACGLLLGGGAGCWGATTETLVTPHEVPNYGRGTASRDVPLFAVTGTKEGRGRIADWNDALAIVTEDGSACARTPGDHVRCIGAGTHSLAQVGYGPHPIEVSELAAATQIAGGAYHSCAVLRSGSVVCWGANQERQLGDGSGEHREGLVNVTGVSSAVEVGVGSAHSCARLKNGDVVCWGSDSSGQLGDGAREGSPLAHKAKLAAKAIQLAVGGLHTCALLADETVTCWGEGSQGEIGDGERTPAESTPRAAKDERDVIQIAAGAHHTCTLHRGGSIHCWGSNDAGQSGQPDDVIVDAPREIAW